MTLLRTTLGGDVHLQGWDSLRVGLATIIIPPLLGLLAAGALGLADPDAMPRWLQWPLAVLVGQTVAPIVTVFITPVALLLGRAMMRRGWAGWGVATLLPAAICVVFMALYARTDTGYVPGAYTDVTAIFTASCVLHGAVMWLSLRLLRPAAVAPRGSARV